MSYNFLPCERDQSYLLPPSVADWLPEGHLAWFVLDAVGQMDLSGFREKYREDGTGSAAYQPEMMVALLLYSYCVGERSSRRIEKLCETDVAFRVITANARPDHATIARFRRRHREELEGLFGEILRLCGAAGLVKVGVVVVDGSKIKASAALAANKTSDGIDAEVKKMLSEAEAKDAEEDRQYGSARGDELPEGLRRHDDRLKRLRECRERLKREAAEREAEHERKLAERAAKEAESGEKLRGRKPKEPDGKKDEEAKANVTDPDSRVMKTRSGYVQGYNAQAVVTEGQVILAAEVTQEANDAHQLQPMLEKVAENLTAAGVEERPAVALADAGYCNEASVLGMKPDGPELFAATTKDWKQRKAMRERPPPRGRIPRGLNWRERMERKLLTRRGRELYRKRGMTVEPVFGQVKDVRGCDGFLLRGMDGAACEWKLICSTHNLLKLWRSGLAVRN